MMFVCFIAAQLTASYYTFSIFSIPTVNSVFLYCPLQSCDIKNTPALLLSWLEWKNLDATVRMSENMFNRGLRPVDLAWNARCVVENDKFENPAMCSHRNEKWQGWVILETEFPWVLIFALVGGQLGMKITRLHISGCIWICWGKIRCKI